MTLEVWISCVLVGCSVQNPLTQFSCSPLLRERWNSRSCISSSIATSTCGTCRTHGCGCLYLEWWIVPLFGKRPTDVFTDQGLTHVQIIASNVAWRCQLQLQFHLHLSLWYVMNFSQIYYAETFTKGLFTPGLVGKCIFMVIMLPIFLSSIMHPSSMTVDPTEMGGAH